MNPGLIRNAIAAAVLLLILYLDFLILENFLEPLAWAVILTICFHPVFRWLNDRIHRPNLAALITLALVTVLLITPAFLVAGACIQQGIELFQQLDSGSALPKVQAWLADLSSRLPFPLPDLYSKIVELAEKLGAFLARSSPGVVGQFASFFFELVIMGVAMFYLFRDGEALMWFLFEISPFDREEGERVQAEISAVVKASVQSNAVVALVQGLLAGLVFWVLSVPAALFWGVVSGILAFLPMIAPALVWLGAAIVLFVQGELWRALAMLVLGFCVISGIDNFLRPALIAGRSQMHGLVTLLSLFGGIFVFGFLGIVLGPLLAAVTLGILRSYRESATRNTPEEVGQ